MEPWRAAASAEWGVCWRGVLGHAHGGRRIGGVLHASSVAIAAAAVLLASGLLHMRNWARMVMIVKVGLGELAALVGLVAASTTSPFPSGSFFFLLILAAIGAFITHCFASSRELFD